MWHIIWLWYGHNCYKNVMSSKLKEKHEDKYKAGKKLNGFQRKCLR